MKTSNVMLGAPLTINMGLSYRCNFACHHCYSRDEDHAGEMTLAQLVELADRLADWKVPFLNIGSGEPLLVPHLYDFVRHATSRGLRCSMNSNGWLLDRDRARQLREAGFSVVGISIDSPVEAEHDEFRSKQGSWGRALAALDHLAAEGIKTTVSMVVSKLNAGNFAEMLPLVRKHGVRQLFLHNYKCSGHGYRNMERYDLSPADWKDFYRRALALKESIDDIVISFDDPILNLLPEYKEAPLVKGSTCGKLSLHIRPNGDVTPCGFMPLVVGNVLRDDIRALWNESPVFTALRNPEPQGKCRSCGVYENCLGGCKARTYMVTGDFNNPDPHCWK